MARVDANKKPEGVLSKGKLQKNTQQRAASGAAAASGPAKVAADDDGDEDEVKDEDEDDESDTEEDGEDDIFARTSLSLSKPPKPLSDPEAASKIPAQLACFTLLTRLDLSHAGLTSTDLLAKAVHISKKKSAKQTSAVEGEKEWFGRRLTWLSMAGNAGLGEELAASKSEAPAKKRISSGEASSKIWSGLELLPALFVLNLAHCALPSPPPIHTLPNLRALILNNNNLSFLTQSSTFPPLPHLNTLILSHNNLTSLPATLPSSCPSLTKLSITFNDLGPSTGSGVSTTSTILPDFTPLLSLREVRLGQNPRLAKNGLPAHMATWAKGTDGSGKGLMTLELNSCGIDDWDKLGPLLKADDQQSQEGERRGGLAVLNLKDNPVCELEGYREKILATHRNLRSLDDTRVVSDIPKKEKTVKKGRNAARPPPASDSNAEPVQPRIKRKRAEDSEESVAAPSEADSAGSKKRSNTKKAPVLKEEGKESKSVAQAGDASPAESTRKKRKHLNEESMPSSSEDSRTRSKSTTAESSQKTVRRGSRGASKKGNKEGTSSVAPMDVDDTQNDDGIAPPAKVPTQSPIDDGDDESKDKKKKKRRKKAAAKDESVEESNPSEAGSKEPQEKAKKLRIRQAKKLEGAVAWDAEPEGTSDVPKAAQLATTSQSAEGQQPPPPQAKTSVVGVVEVRKKKKKTKADGGAIPPVLPAAPATAGDTATATSGSLGVPAIGTGTSEDAWGSGGGGFW
ncbi:unnamed protein product [Tilletia controversa]|uniref:L domain-like protein n=3 Tax=Tilletia TaxID=13289 RepID=A0A8X7MYY2_9BASI|nr:hypothetical protein CF336_g836 [Tilletia laevis]KAE8204092.1 hypothetical protein CF328_g1284 [Tilletia controversa]KAE8264562.1 hypothetical protein A4X03_0g858 [Tilletia caries]KAE8207991.1 hypothetical protein CF335_g740 [Tilletia laevis]KAE8253045.1 hypothetical protein A4X06_0g1747 [Tilletia controversa]